MKKNIILFGVVALYIGFLIFTFTAPHGHHEAGGMKEVVVGHLVDAHLHEMPHAAGDNPVLVIGKTINNFFAVTINHGFLDSIKLNLGSAFPASSLAVTKLVLMMWLAAACILLIFIPLSRSIRKAVNGSPSRWVNFWEVLVGFIHDEVVSPNFDKKYRKKAMPYFLTVFFFIFFCNFLGMIPGMATATGNLAVTMGLALATLSGMIIVGMVRQGPLWIVTGIVPHGIPAPLFPLIWIIELLGLAIKPFALMVRLFANMTAGHIVIIIFLFLVMMFQSYFVGIGSVAGSLMIYMLEVMVGFLQAYIFTTLTAMFIGSSMHAH